MPGFYPRAKFEFHISRETRDTYQFDDTLFSSTGNVIFANFLASRRFAQKMNSRRDLVHFPERAIRAGQVNAMGLIDEIFHFVVGQYRQQRNPKVMSQALEALTDRLGNEAIEKTLRQFTEQFPPVAVYRRQMGVEEYLQGSSILPGGETVSNRQIALEELLMLWLANVNPAFSPYLELFDDSNLKMQTAYPMVITTLQAFFDEQPTFGPDNQNLIDMLRSPAIAVPHSLTGQLEYIRTRWGLLLGSYLYRLLSSLDLIKEEEKAIFMGPGPSRVYDFTGLDREAERFSPDRDWMPNLVLIAKNSYVWLDQLSKKYQRAITRLDQIPDEELDILARWGFTGLWLIGLWERSTASKRIKQLRGNLEAVASAYSLFSYDIAADLGGTDAYQALRNKAWQRGIRLASDMVPNHMGIDSTWVMEHPDWFISLDYSPFPSYTFNGPNLSWDERVGIYIEDHYYDNTDASVVFKRVDNQTGNVKYIYHGNDGTSMPWNDTAQLNYLIPDVREAVIQTILHVARMFPVIRFDAAMTLAKKHYQRLWFPEPGSGGDIPTRAEHGLTREQFEAAFPEEFWRMVVDRVAQEVPDTLLLAEAFWLMEGYFVRTLGMHRVYNSAFMNMLRDEKNQDYRQAIKNTLEFEPEILKRYVNFMNNPDERTAVDQFGKGDKYFGIATMMATMPGLPMFGHGQVEGFTEKYGMEFRRAYWDEQPDGYLVERHEREVFPLLRRRYLFAGVQDFLLYDFFTPEGSVNEDVFAYSNRSGEERALVLYHNRWATARGWVRMSAAFPVKTGSQERALVQKSLGEGLGLHRDEGYFTVFRDQVSGLEFIRRSRELHDHGLYIELEAYKYHVFMDFRELQDNEWRQYEQLESYLGGRGVPSVDDAMKEIFLRPVHTPFRNLVNAGMFSWLIDNRVQVSEASSAGHPDKGTTSGVHSGDRETKRVSEPQTQAQALDEAETKLRDLFHQVVILAGSSQEQSGNSPDAVAATVRQELAAALSLPTLAVPLEENGSEARDALEFLLAGPQGEADLLPGDPAVWGALLAWLFTHRMGQVVVDPGPTGTTHLELARTWMDEWLLGKIIATTLKDLGLDDSTAGRRVEIVKILVIYQNWLSKQVPNSEQVYQAVQPWFQDADIQRFLGVNRYQGVLWYNQESFDELLYWLFAASLIESRAQMLTAKDSGKIDDVYRMIEKLQAAAKQSGYQVERLLQGLQAGKKS